MLRRNNNSKKERKKASKTTTMADVNSKATYENNGAACSGGNVGLVSNNNNNSNSPEMKGWLLKWTNYIKGYQRRWFVLSKGVLSYYRNQAEMNHTCRGTISLHGALIHTVDSCTFVISNGGTQTFHIKAANEVERQQWVTALELAKCKAIRAMENEEEEEVETAHVVPAQEINAVVRDLSERLENLRTCYDLITKHGLALQRALNDLETNEDEPLASRTKIVNERATLFRITSNAMINACSDYLQTAESQGQKWSKMLQHEREHSKRLEEMVEQLAKQHTQLEQAAHLVQHSTKTSGITLQAANSVVSDDDTEFFDAEENDGFGYITSRTESGAFISNNVQHASLDQANTSSSSEETEPTTTAAATIPRSEVSMTATPICSPASSGTDVVDRSVLDRTVSDRAMLDRSVSDMTVDRTLADKPVPERTMSDRAVALPSRTSIGSVGKRETVKKSVLMVEPSKTTVRKRRTRVPDKPNYPLNLWSIMKNCIGKELSKIPMPVNFNEPLSMLQRLTEDYEYAELLDQAAQLTQDECEQLAYVAAFTISCYSTTAHRIGKPFNPLLGETFECDRRDDLGWRCIAEQVSHHPPMAATHCEGKDWTCWQEFTMSSKFRGKYLQVTPMGNAYVHFNTNDHKYVWRKVTTTVNNIIVGKLWIDQHGEMEIRGLGAASGLKCMLKYIPYSYFSREQQRRVKGVVMNRKNEVKYVLRGTWDDQIDMAPVLPGGARGSDGSAYNVGGYKTVWKRRLPPPDSEKYYNFTVLACQLNEPEEGVAPTDSRLRPDQRLMEEGRWDESNAEKVRLEEKQRQKRRQREAEAEEAAAQGRPYPPYQPVWFVREKEEGTDNVVHVYKGNYWEHKRTQDWSMCPDLF